MRCKWTERLADGAYASLPQHMKPLRPDLWNNTTVTASNGTCNGSSSSTNSASLPHDLSGTVAALRARLVSFIFDLNAVVVCVRAFAGG
jgi:hypothetical protein